MKNWTFMKIGQRDEPFGLGATKTHPFITPGILLVGPIGNGFHGRNQESVSCCQCFKISRGNLHIPDTGGDHMNHIVIPNGGKLISGGTIFKTGIINAQGKIFSQGGHPVNKLFAVHKEIASSLFLHYTG